MPEFKLALRPPEAYVKSYYPEWGFRPETTAVPIPLNFIMHNGGMGDYVTWIQALRYNAVMNTWLRGTVICAKYFIELAEYWMKPLGWPVMEYKTLEALSGPGSNVPYRGPIYMERESLNATGAHLLDCGFVYYCNQAPIPEGWNSYPQFAQADLDAILDKMSLKIGEPYAVITTGLTSPSRQVYGPYWNYVIEYVISKGLKPVFLGKGEVVTGHAQNIVTKFDKQVDYSKGINLIDKTSSLLEAAAIMSKAKLVIGHDNGLLHLAACTEVPIVFGYNVASPLHREPRRPKGKTYNVTLTHKELQCIHCQSKTNFLVGFNFNHCFYEARDRAAAAEAKQTYRGSKCLDLLFADGAQRWKTAIDEALSDSQTK